jgi:GRF zinc finger
MPLTGLFIDGIWHCELKVEVMASARLIIRIGNCEPCLPASHLQVRKDSPNKGRWFYTCQKLKGVGCSFFLWESAAANREPRTVLSNSTSESAPVELAESYADRPDKMATEGHVEASNIWVGGEKLEEEEKFEGELAAKGEASAPDTAGGLTNESKH